MSELQLYRLWRTYWVSVAVISAIVLFNLFLTLDIVWWQTWFSSWVTADNFQPTIYGLTAFSLPFWVLGGVAHHKLNQIHDRREELGLVD